MANQTNSGGNSPQNSKQGGKKSQGRGFYGFKSNDGVPPYNELTEIERIAEGSRPNFITSPSFKKTPTERNKWKKVHTNAKGPVGSGAHKVPAREVAQRLTVHLVNKRKDPTFITTYSFDVKPSQINSTIRTFFNPRNLENEDPKRIKISKAYYGGRIFNIN